MPVYVSETVIEELKKIILDSEILTQNDSKWPKPDKIGKQELYVRVGDKEVTLKTSKLGTIAEVNKTEDP